MNFWRNIIVVLSLSGFLAACGVNGRPELPPGVENQKNKDEKSVLDGLI